MLCIGRGEGTLAAFCPPHCRLVLYFTAGGQRELPRRLCLLSIYLGWNLKDYKRLPNPVGAYITRPLRNFLNHILARHVGQL